MEQAYAKMLGDLELARLKAEEYQHNLGVLRGQLRLIRILLGVCFVQAALLVGLVIL